jgi:hypothetical protein
MSAPPPQDPYGQGAYSQPAYGQQDYPSPYPQDLGQEAFPSSYSGASGASRSQIDLATIVSIGAWVVLGLFTLAYLYGLSQEQNGQDVGDRLFGLMPLLGEGIFYSGLLHGVAVWLGRNKDAT